MFQIAIAADRGVLASELSGVEEFLGQDALIALHLPVVAWGVGLGLLVPGLVADDPGEVTGSVAGAVEFLMDVKWVGRRSVVGWRGRSMERVATPCFAGPFPSWWLGGCGWCVWLRGVLQGWCIARR